MRGLKLLDVSLGTWGRSAGRKPCHIPDLPALGVLEDRVWARCCEGIKEPEGFISSENLAQLIGREDLDELTSFAEKDPKRTC